MSNAPQQAAADDGPAPRRPPLTFRQRAARWVLFAVIAGSFVLFQRSRSVNVSLTFDVPPTLRIADATGLTRAEIQTIDADVFDDDAEHVARVVLDFARPLVGPVTHAGHLRLAAGAYQIQARIEGRDGRVVRRTATLAIGDPGMVRVSLD